MGRGYTLVAFYAANEGSLLYITLALALMSTISVLICTASFFGGNALHHRHFGCCSGFLVRHDGNIRRPV